MKNTLLLMLGLVAGTASFAQTTADKAPATSVTVTTDKRVKLIVGREQAVATVSLRDANGNVLYTQKVDLSNGLRQYFNIAELENGAYQLAVSVGNETVTNRFVIDEQPAQKIITGQGWGQQTRRSADEIWHSAGLFLVGLKPYLVLLTDLLPAAV